MDRQIYPKAHILASRGSPSDAKLLPEGQICLSIPYTNDGFFFFARFNAAKLDFHTLYLEKRYNRGVRHFDLKRFDIIVTRALNDENT